MGKISKTARSIVVELDVMEALEWKVLLRLPDQKLKGYDHIGNFISRNAWNIVLERAPQFVAKIAETKISGTGKIAVSFIYEDDT